MTINLTSYDAMAQAIQPTWNESYPAIWYTHNIKHIGKPSITWHLI